MTRRTTTICWGGVIVLSTLLPRAAHTAVQPRPPVPVSLPFEFAWTATLDESGRALLLATDDHLIVSSTDGALSALDPATGKTVWTKPDVKAETAPVAGEGLIFLAGAGRLRAITETTGAERWQVSDVDLVAAVPTWRAGWLLAQTKVGLSAYRASDGAQIWKSPLAEPLSGPLAIDGDQVFAVAGRKILAIGLPTGGTHWTVDLETDANDLLAAHERVYFAGADGKLHCLRQSDGRELWAYPTRTRIVGHPVTDEWSVYLVALDNRLVALERYGGNRRWKAELGARPTPGLTLANGRVVVPISSGELRIHATKNGVPAGVLPVARTANGADTASKLEAVTVTATGVIVRLTTSSGGVQTLNAYKPATFVVQSAATLPGTVLDVFGGRPPRGRP